MSNQRTIKKDITIKGVGLQTGKKVTVKLKSAPVDAGINFIRTDLPDLPSFNIRSTTMADTAQVERRTVLGSGPLQVQTTEHFLAALAGLSIDNLMVEIDNIELPGLDGSAVEFFRALKKAEVVEQTGQKTPLHVKAPIWCGNGDSFLAVFPDEKFKISYTLSYDNPVIGTQFFSSVIDESNFEKNIASARTFCLEEEALELIKRGLGKGANYENTLVIGPNGPVNNAFRFPNELVRHKILDLVGDLFLLGVPLCGHVVAIRSGHRLNMELIQKLREIRI